MILSLPGDLFILVLLIALLKISMLILYNFRVIFVQYDSSDSGNHVALWLNFVEFQMFFQNSSTSAISRILVVIMFDPFIEW